MKVFRISILAFFLVLFATQLQAQKQFKSADEAKTYFDSFLKTEILRANDPLITKFSALPEAKGLKLNLHEVQRVIRQNANITCIAFPIMDEKLPMPEIFKGTTKAANFFVVYYDTKTAKLNKVGMLYTAMKPTRKAANIGGVINHEEGIILLTPFKKAAGTDLAIRYSADGKEVGDAQGNATAYKFSTCLDDSYSGVRGTIAGTAAGACVTGNLFGCGFSAGWLLGSAAVCAWDAW
ncbi:MAG: hypothetical protein ACKVTZ_20010 [Bacteroidia bacterium]